jgi:glycosyltransferase involved in cell wall biosynthesis
MPDVAFLTARMRLGFGVDRVVDEVAAGLAGRGHGVTVYAGFDDGTYADRPYRIERVPLLEFRAAPAADAATWWKAWRMGLAKRPHDVVFVETQPFFSLLPMFRGRGVAVDHGVVDARGFKPSIRVNFAAMKFAQEQLYFRSASQIVTVSAWLRDQLPAHLRPRTTPILNGADHYPIASSTDAQQLRAELGLTSDDVACLYVGRLNPEGQPYKGTAELVRMFATVRERAPRARLVMAGFGTDTDAAWVRAADGIPMTNVAMDRMPALYAAADVFVTASRWEGFNLNAVEAQRAGLPVVAYRVGAHSEVVDSGRSGILVDDAPGFTAALSELVLDETRRRDLGTYARDWAGNFTWRRAVEEYDRVVTHLATRPR